MYSFKNDYSEGAHPDILDALIKYNLVQEEGYGEDSHSNKARALIHTLIGNNKSDIHFIGGGTLTNLLAISSFLRPHEACIAPTTGHIATHEAGAIEATGHKVITIDSSNGKLRPEHIQPILIDHHFEHMVKPRLVYISNPTELGTVYTKDELETLYTYCQSKDLLLYCDGARLGAALVVPQAKLSLSHMATYTDAFFIGGAKLGALIGEALIINNDSLKSDLLYMIKQRGAMLSKGRLIGIQFECLFQNDLYFSLAKHANHLASLIGKNLESLGCKFLIDSPTNQIFPILSNQAIAELQKDYDFYIWQAIDDSHSAIRLITSWATEEATVIDFNKRCQSILK